MDFLDSKKHQMIRKLAKEFTEKEIAPYAAIIDETEKFPQENIKKMAANGFMGIPIPSEFGGQGADTVSYIIALEEISKACATTGVILSAHTSLAMEPILLYGTAEQKEKYLPDLAAGKTLGAFGLTEANAGTDAAAQETKAVLKEDHYILNGNKIFITNGGYADIFIIIAMTDASLKTRGMSAFIVEKDFPGFSVGKEEKKMGIRGSSTCELIMKNCMVPKENLLGDIGKGFSVALKTLDGGRIGIAGQALGIARGALHKTVRYVKDRKQFGRPIAAFQDVQFRLAEMEIQIEASKLLVYKAAVLKDKGLSYSVEAARAKLFAAKTAVYVTNHALELHGGYGYSRDYEVERMLRDAKITEIYEGTNEVQKMVISSALLK